MTAKESHTHFGYDPTDTPMTSRLSFLPSVVGEPPSVICAPALTSPVSWSCHADRSPRVILSMDPDRRSAIGSIDFPRGSLPRPDVARRLHHVVALTRSHGPPFEPPPRSRSRDPVNPKRPQGATLSIAGVWGAPPLCRSSSGWGPGEAPPPLPGPDLTPRSDPPADPLWLPYWAAVPHPGLGPKAIFLLF